MYVCVWRCVGNNFRTRCENICRHGKQQHTKYRRRRNFLLLCLRLTQFIIFFFLQFTSIVAVCNLLPLPSSASFNTRKHTHTPSSASLHFDCTFSWISRDDSNWSKYNHTHTHRQHNLQLYFWVWVGCTLNIQRRPFVSGRLIESFMHSKVNEEECGRKKGEKRKMKLKNTVRCTSPSHSLSLQLPSADVCVVCACW